MSSLAFLFVTLSLSGLVNVLALVASRSGEATLHKGLLACGLIGLFTFPVMLGSGLLVGTALVAASFNSPPGYVFILSSTLFFLSTAGSLILQIIKARQPAVRRA